MEGEMVILKYAKRVLIPREARGVAEMRIAEGGNSRPLRAQ